MKDIKLFLCSLGLPLELVNEEENINLKIEINKRYDVVVTYYNIGDKSWEKGFPVYLSDADCDLLTKCYPKDLTKRLEFLYKKN